jgi:hypothetical protein
MQHGAGTRQPFEDHMVQISPEMSMLGVEHALEGRQAPAVYPRPYLGMSMLGEECPRYIWYYFRWAFKEQVPPRIQRIFDRGHLEEARVIKDLRDAGFAVDNAQEEMRVGPYIRGHCDGVVSGIPDSSKPHVLEIKAVKDSTFSEYRKKGLEKSNMVYWCQVHLYTHFMKLDRALFIATNKDTEERYYERVRLDKHLVSFLVDRAEDIIVSDAPPKRIKEDPSWYACKFCNAREVCHYGAKPERNCRTCTHCRVTDPRGKDVWYCALYGKPNEDMHEEGCSRYNLSAYLSEGSD